MIDTKCVSFRGLLLGAYVISVVLKAHKVNVSFTVIHDLDERMTRKTDTSYFTNDDIFSIGFFYG